MQASGSVVRRMRQRTIAPPRGIGAAFIGFSWSSVGGSCDCAVAGRTEISCGKIGGGGPGGALTDFSARGAVKR